MTDAAIPLLETKLHAPRRRRGMVPRPRLREPLDRLDQAALMLVSAPAGFGKTTFLADCFADGPSTAWLSLDHRDNEPTVFWTYVVAALQTVEPAVGAEALELVRTPQAAMDAVVATLLNDLHAVDHDLVLVLDDYHLIDAIEIHEAMSFLIERVPTNVRVVIATRADPPLPLATVRARGELLEYRASDLRFTSEEATSYLNDSMGLAVDQAGIDVLDCGAGDAFFSGQLQSAIDTASITCWDASYEDGMVAQLARRYSGLAFTRTRPERTFDLILMLDVIEHVDDDRRTAHEMVRVTRPGGSIVVFAPNRLYPFETHGAYVGGRYVFGNIPLINWLPDPLRDRLAPHVRAYTGRGLERLFAGEPVRLVTHRCIYPGFDNLSARYPMLGRILRRALYVAETTPLHVFGLSHFLVLRKRA